MTNTYYSIGEVAKQLNLPISTIRYYDKQGLLPFLKRDATGNRLFDEQDIDILNYIECFKIAGMSLQNIKHYFNLYAQGDTTIEERYALIRNQYAHTQQQIKELHIASDILLDKANTYYQQLHKNE